MLTPDIPFSDTDTEPTLDWQSPEPEEEVYLRLSTEAICLPCRILKISKGNHTLLCEFGVLQGGHQASALKSVLYNKTFGTVTLPSPVSQYHNRRSIATQQVMGTAATKQKAKAVSVLKRKRTASDLAQLEAKKWSVNAVDLWNPSETVSVGISVYHVLLGTLGLRAIYF